MGRDALKTLLFANQWARYMPFLTSADRHLYFELEGRGETTLMFANSLGTSLDMWAPQFEALSTEFRILRYDNRGHGRSNPNDRPADIADLASDAHAILDETGINKVHFVGLSLGGLIGQYLALSNPERLLSLTLCATAANFAPAEAWEQRAIKALDEGIEPFVAISRERWFTPDFNRSSPYVVESSMEQLRQVDPASYAACCRVLRDADLRTRIAAIDLPVHLIAGESDPSTPPAALEAIRACVRGSSMTIIKNAAHLLNIQQPAEVSSLIRSFARRHESDAANATG